MYIDKSLIYSDDQAITGDAASTVVVNAVKAGGPHQHLYLYVKCAAAFNTLTSMNISFQTSDDNFSADTTEVFTKSFLLAALTLNAELIKIDLPMNLKQYTRMYFDVVGTDPTTGAIYAAIVEQIDNSHEVS